MFASYFVRFSVMDGGKERTKLNELGKWSNEKYIRLFEFYEAHPLLWKKTDPNFMNNEKKKRTLNEIGQELGCSGEEAKLRFRSMKQTFQKNIKKNPKTCGAGNTLKPWRFAQHLSFMYDEITQFDSNNDVSVHKIDLNEQYDLGNSTVPAPTSISSAIATSTPTVLASSTPAPAPTRKRKRDENENDAILDKFLHKLNKQDEYDEFGTGLAAILRRIGKINQKTAIDLELKWHTEGLSILKNLTKTNSTTINSITTNATSSNSTTTVMRKSVTSLSPDVIEKYITEHLNKIDKLLLLSPK